MFSLKIQSFFARKQTCLFLKWHRLILFLQNLTLFHRYKVVRYFQTKLDGEAILTVVLIGCTYTCIILLHNQTLHRDRLLFSSRNKNVHFFTLAIYFMTIGKRDLIILSMIRWWIQQGVMRVGKCSYFVHFKGHLTSPGKVHKIPYHIIIVLTSFDFLRYSKIHPNIVCNIPSVVSETYVWRSQFPTFRAHYFLCWFSIKHLSIPYIFFLSNQLLKRLNFFYHFITCILNF